ncbi:unnamed protein product [Urochloa decumbens]|uniref:DUF6598 domain-containing protein n=1 Tax=Urochloa decumbens TaxID=240449 RepID=A0ABC8WDZ8_9POAL
MLPACGRPLVEVFSVRAVGGPARRPPCGSVNVFDGRRGQIIYSHSGEQPASPIQSSSHAQLQDGLLLTGPYRAISADGSVAIKLDLHDASQELAPSSDNKEAKAGLISWDVYEPSEEYDKAISRIVDTRYGPVEVTYAVLSNAVEASVEVTLVRREEEGQAADTGPGAGVRGRIVARSQLFEIETVLFDGEFGQSSRAESTGATTIPLARSILAVPLLWPLMVEADLRARSGDEIAIGSLEFQPEVDGQHVKRLVGRSGAVEVKITWSGE